MKAFIKKWLGINDLSYDIDYLKRINRDQDNQLKVLKLIFEDWEKIVLLNTKINDLKEEIRYSERAHIFASHKRLSNHEIELSKMNIIVYQDELNKLISNNVITKNLNLDDSIKDWQDEESIDPPAGVIEALANFIKSLITENEPKD